MTIDQDEQVTAEAVQPSEDSILSMTESTSELTTSLDSLTLSSQVESDSQPALVTGAPLEPVDEVTADTAEANFSRDAAMLSPTALETEDEAAIVVAQSQSESDNAVPDETLAQDTSPISPGRTTRSGSSYIGVGGNIGLGDGDTALGEGSFAVFSKIGLTQNISVRPALLISDNPTILIPVTFDFIPLVTDAVEDVSGEIGLRMSPFVGAGAAISTGDDGAIDFLATAGLDIPLSSQFTATASVNASLFDNPAVGLLLGVGYNF